MRYARIPSSAEIPEPDELRPLWVHDRQAVLSPSWSTHCATGDASRRFRGVVAGENQEFNEMDEAGSSELR